MTETMSDTDVLIKDHLLGSGALSYPWWYEARYRDEILTLVTIDPDDYDNMVGGILTIDDLREAALEMLKKGYGSRYARTGWTYFYMTQFVPELEAELDLDADSADTLLQYALLGEVVYG